MSNMVKDMMKTMETSTDMARKTTMTMTHTHMGCSLDEVCQRTKVILF